MRKNVPKEALGKASDDEQKIYYALDNLLEVDIMMFKDNNVLIRLRLGDHTVVEYPVHCDVVDNEVLISEYANSKSNKCREE